MFSTPSRTKTIKFLSTVSEKLVDDVRSIDETQVPTDLNLMGVLKKAMLSDKVLWGQLTVQQQCNDAKQQDGYYFQVESKRDEAV